MHKALLATVLLFGASQASAQRVTYRYLESTWCAGDSKHGFNFYNAPADPYGFDFFWGNTIATGRWSISDGSLRTVVGGSVDYYEVRIRDHNHMTLLDNQRIYRLTRCDNSNLDADY